ncbi:hypothetical protein [Stenoxybacter acetivorans]|uniref:hypothetical protein n=1 Tax=Stenoxybacter acetivorans TaxID=422441 RepID=UPI000569C1D2|nr:hypothetical protein [Stenoxybacter acetivorans]
MEMSVTASQLPPSNNTIITGTRPLTEAKYYRFSGYDPRFIHAAISRLADGKRNTRETAFNTLLIREYRQMLQELHDLTAEQVNELVKHCGDVVEVGVNLPLLLKRLRQWQREDGLFKQQVEQVKWLIQHKASNQLILLLCPRLLDGEIKQLRLEMGLPVYKGRLKQPVPNDCLNIQHAWQILTQDHPNLYQRYQVLAQLYPQYELGQLHMVITQAEKEKE